MYIKEFPFGKAVFLDGAKEDELDFIKKISIDNGYFSEEAIVAIFHAALKDKARGCKVQEDLDVYTYGSDWDVILEVPRNLDINNITDNMKASTIQRRFNDHQGSRFSLEPSGRAFELTDKSSFAWTDFVQAYVTVLSDKFYVVGIIDSGLGEDVYLCSVAQRPPQGY